MGINTDYASGLTGYTNPANYKQPPAGAAPAGQVWNGATGTYQSQADYDAFMQAIQGQESRAYGSGLSPSEANTDPNTYYTVSPGGQLLTKGVITLAGAVLGGAPGAIAGGALGQGAVAAQNANANDARNAIVANNSQTAAATAAYNQRQAQLRGAPGAAGGGLGMVSSPLTAGTAPAGGAATASLASMLAAQKARAAPTVAPVTVGPAAQATAQQAGPVTVGPAAQARAQQAGPVTVGPAAQARGVAATAGLSSGATVDQTLSNQTRAQQQASLAGLVNAANGTVPSAAEIQMQQATDKNIRNQLGLAAAIQGHSVGGALKQASDAGASIAAQAASDTAALRANEQATARAQLSSALSGVRTQDLAPATTNAELANATGISNAGNVTQANTATAKILSDIAAGNAAAQNTLTGQQAGIDANLAESNAALGTNVALANAAGQNALTGKQADISSQIGQENAQLGTTTALANMAAKNTLTGQQASISEQSALANADSQLRTMGLDDAQRTAILNAMVQSKGQDLNYTVGKENADTAQSQANWNKTLDVSNLIAGLLAGAGTSGDGTSALSKFLAARNGATQPPGGSPNISSSNFGPANADLPSGAADVNTPSIDELGNTTGESPWDYSDGWT